MKSSCLCVFTVLLTATTTLRADQAVASPSLDAVRLLDGPFLEAAKTNRAYLLAHEPDRLLAPFLREAGLPAKAESYGNWENTGLDGHTAGHYVSALALMVAAGEHTPDGELARRLDYMLDELARCQTAYGDGYIGGVPNSRALWTDVKAGKISAHGFGLNNRWVPLYNIHKTFAALRDAYQVAGRARAREMLIRMGDWWIAVTTGLTDAQLQDMLRSEHGGMNEALADIYAITGDEKYLTAAKRLNHRVVLDPLVANEDKLTGLHANTQIPKVIGLERLAALTENTEWHGGAKFFWNVVTKERSVVFGGNSVGEHFQPKENFRPILESREGPETCNTYNMLKLTEELFAAEPRAEYADYYERALYNHILASIHPTRPGYVYFTPIRPQHYRVYSDPGHAFWCCVGSGMENPGKYGEFIYSRAKEDVYVNLFIPSELTLAEGAVLRQTTRFPDAPSTRLELKLARPSAFKLFIRHPSWVRTGEFVVRINGDVVPTTSTPSSYAAVERTWRDGDVVEVSLPMHTTIERLPDGSDWVAVLQGPIVMVAGSGKENLVGLVADDSRMGHVAHGPTVPLDRVPVLYTTIEDLPRHIVRDEKADTLKLVLKDVASDLPSGVELKPFFRSHDERYQMYWEVGSEEKFEARRERLAAEERARAAFEAATLDRVAIGEQQPEVEHAFQTGPNGNTGTTRDRRWREGEWFQYTLSTGGEKSAELLVTYADGDATRAFDIVVDGTVVATVTPDGERRGSVTKRHPVPAALLAAAKEKKLTVRFVARQSVTARIYELRLMRTESP